MFKCLKEKRLVHARECAACEYKRRPDDISNLWCRYKIGRIYEDQELKAEIRVLKIEAEAALTNMNRWRVRGMEEAARKYEKKWRELTARIRELEEKLK